jgi:hypothetical protein
MEMRVDLYTQEFGVLRHGVEYCSGGAAGAGAQLDDSRGRSDGGGAQDTLFKESRAGDDRPDLKGVFEKLLEKSEPAIQQRMSWVFVCCLFAQSNSNYFRLTGTMGNTPDPAAAYFIMSGNKMKGA